MNRKNFTALLACFVGTALAALLPDRVDAQVANGRATTAAPTYVNNTTNPLSLDLSGNLRVALDAVADAVQVVGNVATGAADSGNPVKIGGIFQTTPSTVTNGQRSNIQVDANGNLRANQVSATITGADNIANTAINGTLPPASSTAATQLNPVAGYVFDGSTWDRMPGTSAGGVSTTVIGALPTGTNTVGAFNIAPRSRLTASASATTTAVVVIATPVTAVGFGYDTVATATAIDFYDNASACTGTVRYRIRPTLVASDGENIELVTPITFANGITVCTNAGTALVTASYY